MDPATLDIDDLTVGQEYSIQVDVTEEDVDRFAALSGDRSPLHMDAGFARSRGFENRVVHGAFLVALVSRLVGVHLPGANGLLQTVHMKFAAPIYVGDSIRVIGVVDQISVAVRVAVVKITVARTVTSEIVASGKATVGFTQSRT